MHHTAFSYLPPYASTLWLITPPHPAELEFWLFVSSSSGLYRGPFSMSQNQKTIILYVLTAMVLAAIFVAGRAMTLEEQKLLFSEQGWVEVLAAVSYVLCAAYFAARPERLQLWPYTVLMLLFAARELDFDKRFTEVGVLKGSFLFSPLVPTHQKLAGGAILVLAIYVLYWIVRHHALPFVKSLLKGELAAIGWAIAIVLLVGSKAIDGLTRKAADFGLTVSTEVEILAWALEEVMELGIGAYILIAAHHRLTQAR